MSYIVHNDLDNRQQFSKYVHCDLRIYVVVAPEHALLGFEAFLLKQCVLLSVEHLKTSRPLDERMKHLLGNYYAKPQYYYLFVEALWRFNGTS